MPVGAPVTGASANAASSWSVLCVAEIRLLVPSISWACLASAISASLRDGSAPITWAIRWTKAVSRSLSAFASSCGADGGGGGGGGGTSVLEAAISSLPDSVPSSSSSPRPSGSEPSSYSNLTLLKPTCFTSFNIRTDRPEAGLLSRNTTSLGLSSTSTLAVPRRG